MPNPLHNPPALSGVLASVVLVSALLPSGVRAQASQTAPPNPSPPSAESLLQMRQELDALKAEESQARAAAQERARRIDALVQQLGATPSEPSSAPAATLPPPPVDAASVK